MPTGDFPTFVKSNDGKCYIMTLEDKQDVTIAELRALIESLKRCGTCRHWGLHPDSYIDMMCHNKISDDNWEIVKVKHTCDKWEIDE